MFQLLYDMISSGVKHGVHCKKTV